MRAPLEHELGKPADMFDRDVEWMALAAFAGDPRPGATLGVVLGGRAGYVLFYKPHEYFQNPIEILQLWHGGMSFHGGALGVLIAMWLFCRQRSLPHRE